MSLKIVDYDTYKNYFKEMATGATGHVALNDFYTGTSREISEAVLSKIKYYCLWLEDFDLGLKGIGTGHDTASFTAAFVILGNCASDDFEKMRTIRQETFIIAMDIVSRMKKDYEERELNIDPDGFSGSVIDSILVDTACGWRIEFKVVDPVAVEFNQNKWKVPEEL